MIVYVPENTQRKVSKTNDNLHLAGKIPSSIDKGKLYKGIQILMNLSKHEPQPYEINKHRPIQFPNY